jgi:hypothetical protein
MSIFFVIFYWKNKKHPAERFNNFLEIGNWEFVI